MPYLFVEYPKCTTCKRAHAFLQSHDVDFVDRHIVKDNPSAEELRSWIAASGLPIKRFFNTSGILYRELKIKDKFEAGLTDDEAIDLLASNGMLVKRPLLINLEEACVLVGFKEDTYIQALKL